MQLMKAYELAETSQKNIYYNITVLLSSFLP